MCQTCYADKSYRDRMAVNARQREWNKRHADIHRATSKAWTKRNPERKRDAELFRLYGMHPGTFARMNEEQDGKCAICGMPPGNKHRLDRRLHVDHDHETGTVRGLLCGPCNIGLGTIGKHLDAALRYLSIGSPAANTVTETRVTTVTPPPAPPVP